MIVRLKYIINILFFSVLFISCKQNQRFDIETNTININIEGSIGQSVRFNNRYYCFFETDLHYNGLPVLAKYFYVILDNGTIEHKLNVPDEINNAYYYDLHIKNDSIVVKVYMSDDCYYFDISKLEWIKIISVDDLVFEDDRFYVTYLDFGEWGSTIWFKDKKTNIEYELAASRPIIHNLNNIYYVTNNDRVIIIEDPLKLKTCNPNYYYALVSKNGTHESSNSIEGTKTIFIDSITDRRNYESNFYIATSFVSDNQLFHLCVDNNGTYIGYINKGKMEIIQRIEKNIFVYKFYNSYRNKIYKKNQLLNFYTHKDNLFGFIEIKENKFSVHYINNQYTSSSQYTSVSKDSIFYVMFDLFNSEINYLSLKNIDSIELKNGGANIACHYFTEIKEDICPNAKKINLEASRTYLSIEDFIIANQRSYFYSKDDHLIRCFIFKWIITSNKTSLLYNNEIIKTTRFQSKFNKIKDYIIDKVGNPNKDILNSDENDITWEISNDKIIKLHSSNFKSYYEIQILMYKK
jgi:hypothetical protein